MTESQFIKKNENDWKELEFLLDQKIKNPDKLNQLFVKISSDLSFARTFYPNRSVRLYLNNLTQRVLDDMRAKERKPAFKTIFYFFTNILPYEIKASKNAFLASFFVFVISIGIGVLSSVYYPKFPNVILGDSYIEMTNKNIRSGDPMAVYKDKRQESMFLGITTNNIRVAFLAFVLGILGSIGTLFILMSNGIMVGAFQYYFYSKGLFWTSFLTIWIHGTIEISAIIIAGAAGFVLGNSLLFPKTYNRIASLQLGGMRALRIIIGVIPLFVIAGILESYVTRQTELPTYVKASIIILSFLLVMFQWVIHPWLKSSKSETSKDLEVQISAFDNKKIENFQFRSQGEVIASSIARFRLHLGSIFRYGIFLCWIPIIIYSVIFIKHTYFEVVDIEEVNMLYSKEGGSLLFVILISTLITYIFILNSMITNKIDLTLNNQLRSIKKHFSPLFLFILIPFGLYYMIGFWAAALICLVFPPHFLITILEEESLNSSIVNKVIISFKKAHQNWFSLVLTYLIILFIFFLITTLASSGVSQLPIQYFSWHQFFNHASKDFLFLTNIFNWMLYVLFISIAYYLISLQLFSERCKKESLDLKRRLDSFGQSSVIFEKY